MSEHAESSRMVQKELKSAVRLHGDGGEYPRADTRVVVRSLVVAGYDHHEIETAVNSLIDRGELYRPEDGMLGVV